MSTSDKLVDHRNSGANVEKQASPITKSYLFRLRKLIFVISPVLIPFAFLIGTGLYGLDFGYHWDEEILLDLAYRSVENNFLLLPDGFYNYPSVSYWLTISGFVPQLLSFLISGELVSNVTDVLNDQHLGIRTYLLQFIRTEEYHLQVRAIFLIVSSLTIVWVYLLQIAWKQHWLEALLASFILGLSWEVAYHLRWIAPDGILMQFGALTLMFAIISIHSTSSRYWLWLAAISAGLACGTKYLGGLLLVPVLIAAYQSQQRESATTRILMLRSFEVLLIFGFSYIFSTPGTILQPLEFGRDIVYEMEHYQTGHHGHTVAAGVEHLRLNITYLALTLFSPNPLIAGAFFIFSLLGIVALFKESRQTAWLFLSFPILYLLYISLQRAMIVRNLLVIAPFLAILAARGIGLSWQWMLLNKKHLVQRGVMACIVLMLVTNGLWLIRSADSIYNRTTERFTQEALAYVVKNQKTRIFVSPNVLSDFESLDGSLTLPNITTNLEDNVDAILLYSSEGLEQFDWPATHYNLTVTWFGPQEVNFNYYPNWGGDDRILLITIKQAREIGVIDVLEKRK